MKFKKVFALSFSICVCALGASFTSCSSDDNNSGDGNEALAGIYKHSEADAIVEVTNEEIKDDVIEAVKSLTSANDDVFVFKLDGSYETKSSAEAEAVKGTYELKGVQLILSKDDRSFTYENSKIGTSADVKAIVAERLGIDEAEIEKAERVDVYGKISR